MKIQNPSMKVSVEELQRYSQHFQPVACVITRKYLDPETDILSWSAVYIFLKFHSIAEHNKGLSDFTNKEVSEYRLQISETRL